MVDPAQVGYAASAGGGPPRRRGPWLTVLIAGCAVVLVLVAAIIVVAALRRQSAPSPGPGPTGRGASGVTAGPVDTCLVGRWEQSEYQGKVDFTGTDVGKRLNLGTVTMSGGGKVWSINPDGSAVEDDNATRYEGSTSDGRRVEAVFTGEATWTLSTIDNTLRYAGIDSRASVLIRVDGAAEGRIALQPNQEPGPYTCTGDVWRTSSPTDTGGYATMRRRP